MTVFKTAPIWLKMHYILICLCLCVRVCVCVKAGGYLYLYSRLHNLCENVRSRKLLNKQLFSLCTFFIGVFITVQFLNKGRHLVQWLRPLVSENRVPFQASTCASYGRPSIPRPRYLPTPTPIPTILTTGYFIS